MSNFKLNIFTPHGVVIRNLECNELVIPTTQGEINILKDHTHIISEIDTGVLSAKTANSTRYFSMTSGLVKVLGEDITILSTTAEKSEDIDMDRARNAKAKAESRLSEMDKISSSEQVKFKRKLDRANLRIKLKDLHK